jgi:hypothetical protein
VLPDGRRAASTRSDQRVALVARMPMHHRPLDREPELGHLGQTACAQRPGSAVQQLPRRRLLVRPWRLVGEEGGGHASFYRTHVRQATVVGACVGARPAGRVTSGMSLGGA